MDVKNTGIDIPPPPRSPPARELKPSQTDMLQTFRSLSQSQQAAFVSSMNTQIADAGGVPVDPNDPVAIEEAVVTGSQAMQMQQVPVPGEIPQPPPEPKDMVEPDSLQEEPYHGHFDGAHPCLRQYCHAAFTDRGRLARCKSTHASLHCAVADRVQRPSDDTVLCIAVPQEQSAGNAAAGVVRGELHERGSMDTSASHGTDSPGPSKRQRTADEGVPLQPLYAAHPSGIDCFHWGSSRVHRAALQMSREHCPVSSGMHPYSVQLLNPSVAV